MIGNAVPVKLAETIATKIKADLRSIYSQETLAKAISCIGLAKGVSVKSLQINSCKP